MDINEVKRLFTYEDAATAWNDLEKPKVLFVRAILSTSCTGKTKKSARFGVYRRILDIAETIQTEYGTNLENYK